MRSKDSPLLETGLLADPGNIFGRQSRGGILVEEDQPAKVRRSLQGSLFALGAVGNRFMLWVGTKDGSLGWAIFTVTNSAGSRIDGHCYHGRICFAEWLGKFRRLPNGITPQSSPPPHSSNEYSLRFFAHGAPASRQTCQTKNRRWLRIATGLAIFKSQSGESSDSCAMYAPAPNCINQEKRVSLPFWSSPSFPISAFDDQTFYRDSAPFAPGASP